MPYKSGRKSLIKGAARIGSRTERIKIPQPVERPIHIKTRDVVRRNLLRNNPFWWIMHRRGIRRPKVGQDPLEARAVPHSLVRGTLPERIVYKWLVDNYFTPGWDFDFQSSLQGGRAELGGIVADYIFRPRMMILQVQGPTHDQFLRQRKDSEQLLILSQMGFTVEYIEDQVIYNESRFEDEMRRILNLRPMFAGSWVAPEIDDGTDSLIDPGYLDRLYGIALRSRLNLHTILIRNV